MSTQETKPKNKWSIYFITVIGIFLVSAAMWAVSGFIIYPTEKHQTTAVELNQLSREGLSQVLSGRDPSSIYEGAKFKSLEQSSEARYSAGMDTVLAVVQLVVFIAIIFAAWRYLKENKLAKKPAFTTAALSGIACTAMFVVTILLSGVFYPISTTEATGISIEGQLMAGIPMTLILTTLLTYLIVRIFQWLEDRKARKLTAVGK